MSVSFETENFIGGLTYNTGWFEHKEYGDEYGGSLTFDEMSGTYVLGDYDGISGYVPKEVCDKIEGIGDEQYDMSYGRDPEGLE